MPELALALRQLHHATGHDLRISEMLLLPLR